MQHNTEPVFMLVKSLEPYEKRYFKMYMKRLADFESLKVIQLFIAVDKQKNYDEVLILKKNPQFSKKQISNLKANLFHSILVCLRLIKQKEDISLQLTEQFDFAKIVYNKGMYIQCLKILNKIKEIAIKNNQLSFLLQAQFLEKKIELMHITRSVEEKASQLSIESTNTIKDLTLINSLSNLSLFLYSWYAKNGYARHNDDVIYITNYFKSNVETLTKPINGFYQKVYYFQAHCWYSFIIQDFLNFYKFSKKWVLLFETYPNMVYNETILYIKAVHNLLTALFNIKKYQEFFNVLSQFEQFTQREWINNIPNFKIQSFIYLNLAKLNQLLLNGDYQKCKEIIPQINNTLTENKLFIDKHRILVFYYKFASLYFAGGDYEKCIDYLNKIINSKSTLRTDIQCYARFLLLIAHYELKNDYLIPYLIKSVYRFLNKMETLNLVEEEVLKFVSNFFEIDQSKLTETFNLLLVRLKEIEKIKIDNRAFMYLDIIAWLESKLTNCTIAEIFCKRLKSAEYSNY